MSDSQLEMVCTTIVILAMILSFTDFFDNIFRKK